MRDKKIADGIESKVDSKLIEEKAKLIGAIKASVNIYLRGLNPDRITKYKDPQTGIEREVYTSAVEVSTVSDFVKLIDAYLKLIGEDSGDMDSFKRREAARADLIARIDNLTGRLALEDGDTQAGELSEDDSDRGDSLKA